MLAMDPEIDSRASTPSFSPPPLAASSSSYCFTREDAEIILEERLPSVLISRGEALARLERRIEKFGAEEIENESWTDYLHRVDHLLEKMRAGVQDAPPGLLTSIDPYDLAQGLDECEMEYQSMADQLSDFT